MSLESLAAAAAADDDDDDGEIDWHENRGCSCLPFCFGGSKFGVGVAPERRRRKFRLKLSWFSWSWFRKNKKNNKKKGRRRLLWLFTSFQAKKASASASGSLFPKASSFGDTKRQNGSKSRPAVDNIAPSTRIHQKPQSTKEPTSTARPETCQPCTKQTDKAGNIDRIASRCRLFQPDRAEPEASLWTMATTLGVIVFLGRVSAVIFLCSCLYCTRFVRAQAGGVKRNITSGSRRYGNAVAETVVDLCSEEYKKKVVMEGLLERAGKRPSSRFCK